MKGGNLLLAILGGLLLLPGLCGGFVNAAMVFEHAVRGTLSFGQYEDMIWMIAVPSLNIGLVGLWLLVRFWGPPLLRRIVRPAVWIVVGFNLFAALLFLFAPNNRLTDDPVSVTITLIVFLGTLVIGAVPCMMLRRE